MNNSKKDIFKEFLINNRIKINHYLNKILWFFVITGPAIAMGVKLDIFPYISYNTCFLISLLMIILSAIHLFLLTWIPKAVFTSLFAITALDILLVYMDFAHVRVYMTWFLVPLLSIPLCSKGIYFYALSVNYILMFCSAWVNAPYYSSKSYSFDTELSYFLDVFCGFTIENIIMAGAGYLIVKIALEHYETLFNQQELIRAKEHSENEKMEILNSMAEIYDKVNLIDFNDSSEMSLRDDKQVKHSIDMEKQTHTLMNQRLINQIMPDQLESFLNFTNIRTVRKRLTNKKIISADFIDIFSGWFRASYITVNKDVSGVPDIVIYTIRNVDDEKKREENLIRLSMTDEMTRLFNRRCYDDDLNKYKDGNIEEDFVFFSIDVNGLKKVNDTIGHLGGDELIKGTADCLSLSIREFGRNYRTGGDEFMAIVHTLDPEKIREQILKKASEWHGIYSDELSLSVGYATYKEHKGISIFELEQLADVDMYREKRKYYKSKGIDRRDN